MGHPLYSTVATLYIEYPPMRHGEPLYKEADDHNPFLATKQSCNNSAVCPAHLYCRWSPKGTEIPRKREARHIVEVDGKKGLFRGLTPRLVSSTLSTITRGSVKKAFPLEDMEHVSNKDDMKTSLRKVVKETSHEMMMQCASRVVSHPLHVISMRCMVQFVGREVKYSGVFSAIGRILKEEGILGFFVGLVPHILGDVIFLWCCNLLAHFINTYAVDDNFSQASVIRSYTKFVMGIAVSMLTYPFLLVGDLMAVNNCGLRAGLPPYAPAFTSWIHCWRHLRAQGQLFRGSSLLFRRAPTSCFPID
ncbi:PREDICTED: mitochondrial carrier homolog 1 [Tinamus guttatus]|uniref:mitochondrial carrier homolog 1 n=1 Tax=Tinamus guttatus TaxID=94827 RepID=UPI00052EC4BC|nr:PREDICTED: mitochondrial carrier homolog 1 [Tinamus guttatus]